jgi:hypothetical protein
VPVEPDCELEVRYAVGCRENSVRVEDEVGVGSIKEVGRLPGSVEPAGGVLFADEVETRLMAGGFVGISPVCARR